MYQPCFLNSALTFTVSFFFQKYKLKKSHKHILPPQHSCSSFYSPKIHTNIKHCLVPAGGEIFFSFSLPDRLANCLILISGAVKCVNARAKSRKSRKPQWKLYWTSSESLLAEVTNAVPGHWIKCQMLVTASLPINVTLHLSTENG